MKIKISNQEYDVMKDGVIIAEEGDEITFKFADLTFIFKIIEMNSCSSRHFDDDLIVSNNNKLITLPIKISWEYLSTTFSKRIELASYEEGDTKKKLYISYVITGLRGDSESVYEFRYTWYSEDIQKQ